MRFARWVQRQRSQRLFLIFWGAWIVMQAAVWIGVDIGFAASHPGQAHMLPAWAYIWPWIISTVIASAGTAAIMVPIVRRSARIQLTKATQSAN